jgi:hypothetical protein
MNDPENRNVVNAHRCDVLGLRMTPNSFEVTELTFSLSQARERLQTELAELLARHPLLQEENSDAT